MRKEIEVREFKEVTWWPVSSKLVSKSGFQPMSSDSAWSILPISHSSTLTELSFSVFLPNYCMNLDLRSHSIGITPQLSCPLPTPWTYQWVFKTGGFLLCSTSPISPYSSFPLWSPSILFASFLELEVSEHCLYFHLFPVLIHPTRHFETNHPKPLSNEITAQLEKLQGLLFASSNTNTQTLSPGSYKHHTPWKPQFPNTALLFRWALPLPAAPHLSCVLCAAFSHL